MSDSHDPLIKAGMKFRPINTAQEAGSRIISDKRSLANLLAKHPTVQGKKVYTKENNWLAEKFISSRHPILVCYDIYERGVAIEVGVLIRFKHRSRLNEYIHLMHQVDTEKTLARIEDQGDGVIFR